MEQPTGTASPVRTEAPASRPGLALEHTAEPETTRDDSFDLRSSIPGDLDRDASAPLALLADRLQLKTATVAVVGLGYVGLPLLVAAAREGFDVIGVDADTRKIEALRRGQSYVVDTTPDDLQALRGARVTDSPLALLTADAVIVAVPTPLKDGGPDLSLVTRAAADIAEVLRPGQLVVLESTTYPGTTEEVVLPILEGSGLKNGQDFALGYSPERIDPGSSWHLQRVPKIVSGVGGAGARLTAQLYRGLGCQVVAAPSTREAEMAKLIENTFRQVNIALVNELATAASDLDVDIWAALEAAATKPFGYMPFWPGPGVGGHCIAIDPSYLSWRAEQRRGFGLGFVQHALEVNNSMPAYVAQRVGEMLNEAGKPTRGSKVLAVGVSYKPGVNDTRESPAMTVIERLARAGAEVAYHDPFVPTLELLGDELTSRPLSGPVIAEHDCVVLLAAARDLDVGSIARSAQLVFDAQGLSRGLDATNVVRL
jgi:UDP-N-acetyl-D-glucosamine dehydrogenase